MKTKILIKRTINSRYYITNSKNFMTYGYYINLKSVEHVIENYFI